MSRLYEYDILIVGGGHAGVEAAAAAAEAGVQAADVPARQMRSLLDQAQELLSDYLKPENTPKENGL